MVALKLEWIRHAPTLILPVLLAAGTLATPDLTQHPGDAVATGNTCHAKSVWEAEAELFQGAVCLETRWGRGQELLQSLSAASGIVGTDPDAPDSTITSEESTAAAVAPNTEQDHDADSLLDSASFLSFEDWKKQNLAKVGQSADNVGGNRRSVGAGKDTRRQPGINNALDSLGDDAEIELDFGGFGETPEASPTAWGTPIPSQHADHSERDVNHDSRGQRTAQTEISRRKDAGVTCKERFNYASFDCAATVLKTNSESKGSSAILVENKDSYMLNECRAQNKFLILELCDDILVDTVVLANYEFFSSIFHTFRVSVSDRYPAKPDQWKELGVYEARNTREVQAFAVQNSLIWARYLRIEFLTHYGHEFFCPVSLVRIHGTTMMEEYKHDESHGQAEAEDEADAEQPIQESQHVDAQEDEKIQPQVEEPVRKPTKAEISPNPLTEIEAVLLGISVKRCGLNEKPPVLPAQEGTPSTGRTAPPSNVNTTIVPGDNAPVTNSGSAPPKAAEDARKASDSPKAITTAPDASAPAAEPAQQDSAVESTGRTTTNPKEDQQNPPPESTRPTSTQPPSSNPTTQESFFKSVHKRLQMLESNSTLSLLYIEEQSRILRDAFNKVEKRQLSKTSNFLENLNVTVLNELKEFREQYDHVWKSVAFEFEHQRLLYHQEVHSLSAQLGVLADELVFQKRVTVIQSIMVMCCFALVLFSRGSVSNYMEFPRVQRMVARSYSLRSSSPIYASPSASPGSTRPTSSYRQNGGHQRNISDTSSSQDSPASPDVAYIPPTPTSDVERELGDDKADCDQPRSPDSMSLPIVGSPHYRSHSTPPVLNGHTTDLDLNGVEDDGRLSSEVQASTPSDEDPPRTS